MKETIVRGVLDWPSQKADFERDGSLRDIYIQSTTIDDWKLVVAAILGGNYGARFERDGAEVPWPTALETVFDENDRRLMSFTVGGVVVDCYFFSAGEIELSFAPNDVTETSLRALLALMVEIGDATKKCVLMTPENGPQSPIFSYEPSERQLRWFATRDSRC